MMNLSVSEVNCVYLIRIHTFHHAGEPSSLSLGLMARRMLNVGEQHVRGVENSSKCLNICYFMCYRHGEGHSQLLATFARTTTVTQLYECCMQLKLLLTRKSSISSQLHKISHAPHPPHSRTQLHNYVEAVFMIERHSSAPRICRHFMSTHKFLSVKLTELLCHIFMKNFVPRLS